MKKQDWLLTFLLFFILALTGCGLMAEADEEPLKPLDVAAWPTPETPTPAASPTPFPRVILTPAATLTPIPAVTTAATEGNLLETEFVALAPTTASTAEPTQTATVTSPHEGLPVESLARVADGQVIVSAVNVRQGPGPDYAALGALRLGQVVDVLATNSNQDWGLIQSSGLTGWVWLAGIDLMGVSGPLPVVHSSAPDQAIPAGEIAPISVSGRSASPHEGDSVQTGPTTPQAEPISFNSGSTQANPSPALAGLEAVTTARIAKTDVYVRPGPSADYAAIDKLSDGQEELSVLALDFGAQWALVLPAFSKTGWVALDDLTVTGHELADAPQVLTAWVESNAVEVRRGPGIFHDQTGQLAINSLVRVWGLDDSRSWAMIQPIPGGSLGWSPIQFLKNVGQPWASVPQAPDLPVPTPVAAATVEPFTPARPVSESKIVFQRSSGGDIMVINPDGAGLRRLTSGIDPVLSPDGQTVAFTRWEGESGSLWLIGIDGSNERQVLGFIKQAKGPDWSPDGTQIVLNYQHEGRLDYKTECTAISKGQQPQPPRNADNVKVKIKDGKPYLCWTLPPDPHWGLKVVNLADGSFKDVDGGTYAFRPAWDPVQSWRIVSDGGRGLLAVDLNRDNRQNLTDEINDGSPVFSPDGRYIAVTTGKEGGDSGFNLYRLNADGSGRVQLTQTPLWVTSQPDAPKAWNNVAPAWSPDASQIIFLTDRTGRWEIWVMNADGSNPHPLFSNEVNAQLQLEYNFVDERGLSWR